MNLVWGRRKTLKKRIKREKVVDNEGKKEKFMNF